MQELVDAINQSHSKDLIDIISIFSPLVLSVVAIAISVYTMHKQNKISLFEKRFKVYCQFQKCWSFERLLETVNNSQEAITVFSMAFDLYDHNALINRLWFVEKYNLIQEVLMQAPFLFKEITDKEVSDLCKSLLAVLLKIEKDEDFSKEKEAYCEHSFKLLQKFSKIHKQLGL